LFSFIYSHKPRKSKIDNYEAELYAKEKNEWSPIEEKDWDEDYANSLYRPAFPSQDDAENCMDVEMEQDLASGFPNGRDKFFVSQIKTNNTWKVMSPTVNSTNNLFSPNNVVRTPTTPGCGNFLDATTPGK
jgi:hypothetical protein